mmetsp:Transcript_21285/g.66040  ORF Transcript_21285/g.66040 Transcript_21285/m.66040 type:complete len:225 (-) Transcript_21285:196-870(-)
MAEREPLDGRPRDHDAVIGAQPRRWRVHREAVLLTQRAEPRAHKRVGRDAARDDERRERRHARGAVVVGSVADRRVGLRAALLGAPAQRIAEALLEVRDRRKLKGGGEVCALRLRAAAIELANARAHGGLEAGEREACVLSPRHRHGQRCIRGVAAARKRLERCASAAAHVEPEQPRDLVVRLAERVVEGRADDRVVAHAAAEQQLAVPARDEQAEEGEGQLLG